MDDELQSQQAVLFHWQWNIKLLWFALIFLPITVTLGFWQLQRAEQKQDILTAQQQRVGAAEVAIEAVLTEPENQFRNVVGRGDIDKHRVFLLDNRVRHGRPGYEVLVPMKLKMSDSTQWLLVNRGWLAGGLYRSVLPKIPSLEAGEIHGYLYRSPGKSIVLKDETWPKNQWPLVIQAIDVGKISDHLGFDVYPYILRVAEQHDSHGQIDGFGLNSDKTAVLETGWPVINVQPEKHIAYAVQWFLMALALLVLTIFANSNLSEFLGRNKQGDQK